MVSCPNAVQRHTNIPAMLDGLSQNIYQDILDAPFMNDPASLAAFGFLPLFKAGDGHQAQSNCRGRSLSLANYPCLDWSSVSRQGLLTKIWTKSAEEIVQSPLMTAWSRITLPSGTVQP